MKKWIKDLLELQTADIRTKKMKLRLREIPKEKAEIKKSLEHEQVKVNAAKEEIKNVELKIRQLETKIDGHKAKIQDFLSKSSMVKKNNEYKALLGEIDLCKGNIGNLETQELGLMDKQDDNKKNLQLVEKQNATMEREANESIEELDELAESLDEEIESSLEGRKKLLNKIEPRLVPIYKRLIQKEGEPLTRVHNSTCGNCHLRLTPQTINDSKKGMITSCDTCGHLIYYSEED